MAQVSAAERDIVTGMRRVVDARMSLASALLKRSFVSYALQIPWQDVRIGRRGDNKHGKPCAVDRLETVIPGIDFNVSHSGGLVALIGYCSRPKFDLAETKSNVPESIGTSIPEVLVGTDIVCVNEQDHLQTIEADGFESWVDMFEDVFSTSELRSMKYEVDWLTLEDGSILIADDIGCFQSCIDCNKRISLRARDGRHVDFDSRRILESKLRRFLSYWCYKEAYIKLSGEALLAPWLKELQFYNVRSPKPANQRFGEDVDDVQIYLRGKPVTNVRMKIYAYGKDFMVSTAIQGDTEHIDVSAFTMLDLDKDVLALARR